MLSFLHQVTTSADLTHWGRDKMDASSQTTFSNAFSWMKPLSEPMMVSFLRHICVTRPQWVKVFWRCHDMETLYLISGPFRQWSTNHYWISLTKVQYSGVLMISLLLAWTSCTTNSWVVGDLRFQDVHMTSLKYFLVKQCPVAVILKSWNLYCL